MDPRCEPTVKGGNFSVYLKLVTLGLGPTPHFCLSSIILRFWRRRASIIKNNNTTLNIEHTSRIALEPIVFLSCIVIGIEVLDFIIICLLLLYLSLSTTSGLW